MQKPIECIGCPLEKRGNGFSRPKGNGEYGVKLIGESLGREEYIVGYPFYEKAQAGSALLRACNLAGLELEKFVRWNLVACQPPNNQLEGTEYGERAIEHCKVHFDRVVGASKLHSDNVTNSVLLALGNLPLQVLAGVSR